MSSQEKEPNYAHTVAITESWQLLKQQIIEKLGKKFSSHEGFKIFVMRLDLNHEEQSRFVLEYGDVHGELASIMLKSETEEALLEVIARQFQLE